MDIILCTDKYYVMPCGITIFSICYHNKNNKIHFHLLVEGITEFQKQEITSLVHNYNQQISFYEIDNSSLEDLPINNRFRVSIYYRLLMAKILPNNLNKILYLDSDIIVRGDLKEIWEIDINNMALGAVLDQSCDDVRHYNRTRLPYMSGYYNSGVLLINLDYWRNNAVGDTCIRYLNENANSVLYPDQDALNVITYNKWIILPFKYNTQAYMYYRPEEILARKEYAEEMIKDSKNPLILHYTESRKPWMEGCKHPYTKEYLKYKDLSPWKNVPLIKKRNTGKIDYFISLIKKICKLRMQNDYTYYRDTDNCVLKSYNCQL